MEVGEAHALVVQAVEVRRLEDRVAVARQVAVPLVIGQNKDDVGPAPFQCCRRIGPDEANEEDRARTRLSKAHLLLVHG